MRALLGLPALVVATLILGLSLPVLFGCRSLVVMSGSMEPAIPLGSVVVVRRIPASAVAPGDVISFRAPEASGSVLTHRVQAVTERSGRLVVETRGDANTGAESWGIDPGGTVGRVLFHVPLIGYALAPLQGPLSRVLLVVAPALLLGALLVLDVWRSPAGGRRSPPGRPRGPVGSRA